MNPRMLRALVVKDLRLFIANRFFAFVTILGLVAYVVMFYLLPQTVDETLELGLVAAQLPETFRSELRAEGVILNAYATEAALKEAVQSGDEPVGIVLPPDLVAQLAGGQRPQARIYFAAELPVEYREAYSLFLEELGYTLAGRTLNITATEEYLGPDMAGQQVPTRQRMLPMLAVFLLAMETMSLSSLISGEIEGGTLQALLVTPLKAEGLFVSKAITGVGTAFLQAALLIGLTGGLQREPLLILVTLLLGALLVTGVAFMIASVAHDLMSVMAWGILTIIVLSIPAMNVLLPGLISNWIKVIPTYYLSETLFQVINFNAGWAQAGGNLLALLAFSVVLFSLGVVVLRRKFE